MQASASPGARIRKILKTSGLHAFPLVSRSKKRRGKTTSDDTAITAALGEIYSRSVACALNGA